MKFPWPYLISFTIFLLTSKHVFGPVMVRATSGLPASWNFDQLPVDYPLLKLPANFPQRLYQLECLGFSLVSHLVAADQGRIRMVVSLLVNRDAKTSACICFMVANTGGKGVTNDYVEFSTDFADGFEVNTLNSSTVSVFHPVPQREVVRVPQIKDVSALYDVHAHRIAQQMTRHAVLPLEGQEVEHFSASFQKAMGEQVEHGYYFLDHSKRRYRPTWAGAIRSTWRLL